MGGGGERRLRERAVEYATIDEALDAAIRGQGGVLGVEGAAGIGKTSLVAAACERAAAAAVLVLSARGGELERDFAWGVVQQLVEPILYQSQEPQRERWFAGAAALARPLFEDAEGVARAVEGDVQFRRCHGLYWLVANLAREAPVLVGVDDAQWADEPSVAFLRHLASRCAHLRVLVLVGCRPHRGGVTPLWLEPGARVLRPAPLSRPGVHASLAERLGTAVEESFTAACYQATGGNPFLIEELVREIDAEGIPPTAMGAQRLRRLSPRAVSTAVLLRLEGLPAAPRRWRGPPRCWARRSSRSWPGWPGSTTRPVCGRWRTSSRRGCSSRPRPCGSSTRSSAPRCTTSGRRSSGRWSTLAPPACFTTAARTPSASRPSSSSRRGSASRGRSTRCSPWRPERPATAPLKWPCASWSGP